MLKYLFSCDYFRLFRGWWNCNNFSLTSGAPGSKLTNCYSFSAGTGLGDSAFVSTASNTVLSSCKAYNSYSNAFNIGPCSGNWLINCVSDTVRGGSNIYITGAISNRIYNFVATGASSYAVQSYTQASDNYIMSSSLTAGGSGKVYVRTTDYYLDSPTITIQETGEDSVLYYSYGTIEHDSSAECRSGKCLKFMPTSATYSTIYRVGSAKVTSTSSDMTLNAYLKDDASFDGTVVYRVSIDGKWLSDTEKTPTTSYVKESVVVSASDLIESKYLDLWVITTGAAGSVYIDDFSADQ